jgi:hypothetical protein
MVFKLGPFEEGQPPILIDGTDRPCQVCGKPVKARDSLNAGDRLALVPGLPADFDNLGRAAAGRPPTVVLVMIHWDCRSATNPWT